MGPETGSTPFFSPLSALEDIQWPAVPGRDEARLLALDRQLEQTQWLPTDVLTGLQLRQLERLLSHAARTVPYFRDRLDALAGIKRGALTLDDWRRLPVMTRADLQQAGEDINSRALPKGHGPTGSVQSSGSTGQPVVVASTAVTGLFFHALNLRIHRWQGMDFSGTVAAIRAIRGPETDLVARGEAIQWVPGYRSGPMHLFDITQPIPEQVDWLLDRNPDYLLTYPTNLRDLLDEERLAGKLPRLRKVLTMTEILDARLRARCLEVWGVPIVDTYSAMELGMIALQCPDHPHYHVQSENLLVEVLDDNGVPTETGGVGRLVVSDLHNFATPMVRYEVGDFAEVGPPCPCGRGLPVLRRILGRTRNMVTFPSGERAWPVPWYSSELLAIAPIRQIRMRQWSRTDIEVALAVETPLTREQEQRLTSLFLGRLGHPFRLHFTYVPRISRSAGGKFEDFISDLD